MKNRALSSSSSFLTTVLGLLFLAAPGYGQQPSESASAPTPPAEVAAAEAPQAAKPAPTATAPAPQPKPAASQPTSNAKTEKTKPTAQASKERSEAGPEALPPTESEKLLADLEEEQSSLAEVRGRVASASGEERELLEPQLRDEESRFRTDLVQGAEKYLALIDATKAEAEQKAKKETAQDKAPVEAGADAADEKAPAKALPSDAPKADVSPTPSLAEREASAQKALRAFLVKHLSAESKLLNKTVQEDALSFRKALAALEKAKDEDKAALEEQRNSALIGRTDRLAEWNEVLNSLVSLQEGVDTELEAFKKQLTESATMASAVLHTLAEALEQLGDKPEKAEGDEARQQKLEGLRDMAAEVQQKNIELMDAHDLDTVELKQGLISTTGKVSKEVLDADVASGLIKQWKDDATDWIEERASMLIFRSISFILIVALFWLLSRIAQGLARKTLDRPDVRMSTLAVEFGVRMTGRVVLAIGVVLGASQLGIEVGPLLAGLGIAGFVLGFALQSTLSNFASGIMILMYRPFDVGDVIEAGGVMGTVNAMNLVSTTIVTFDNQMLMVPNNKIWGDVIRNVTHQPQRRVDLVFGIGYGDDIDHAEAVLKSVIADNELVLEDPAPIIKVHELADSSVNFIVRPWVKTPDYWDAYWNITREVKKRFDAEGVSIPFPQRDVHVYQETAPPQTATPRPSAAAPQERTPEAGTDPAIPDDD